MSYDAYYLSSTEGLLEIKVAGEQDFTVNVTQYNTPIIYEDNSLIHFTISSHTNLLASTYLAEEQGFLIGNKNLHIVNKAGVRRIIFFSNNEDYINIIGHLTVEGTPTEIIFVGSKIYGNNFGFSGVNKVTFFTIPEHKELDFSLLTEHPDPYCLGNPKPDFDFYIDSKGFLSSGTAIEVFANKAKFVCSVDIVKEIIDPSKSANDSSKAASSPNTNLLIKANHAETRQLLKAGIVNIKAGTIVLASGKIEALSEIQLSGLQNFKLGSNSKVIANKVITINGHGMTLILEHYNNAVNVNIIAPNLALINENGTIHIDAVISILAKDSLSLTSNLLNNYGVLKAQNYLEIMVKGEIQNFGKIVVIIGRGFLQGSNFYLNDGALIKTVTGLKVIVDSYVVLKPNSAFYVEKLDVHNQAGGRITELRLESADMVITSDMYIKSNKILVTRAGNYQKAQHHLDPNLLKWDHRSGYNA